MSLIGTKKQPSGGRTTSAFTIVELIIVIVVIAVLATIAVIAYNGVTRRAAETSLQADLDTASSQLASYAKTGVYPPNGNSLVASNGNTLTYALKPYGYCITATNPKTPNSYVLKSSTNQVGQGDCTVASSAYTGNLPAGYSDGACSSAQFNFQPNTNGNGGGAVWDSAGNMYVADPGNQVIRKITPDCTVSTYAGTPGVAGTVNGPIATAQFNYPAQIVMDSRGNLLVSDRGNGGGIIRKITPDGIVSTLATGAPMGRAGSMTIYNDTLYVTRDEYGSSSTTTNNSVSRVLSDGTIQPFVGNSAGTAGFADGTGTAASFYRPSGITADTQGNLYVADSGNNRIRKITQAGVVTTYAGTGVAGSTDGPSLSATFASPRNVAIDKAGWLYVRGTGYYAGTYNDGRVRVISPDGTTVSPFLWTNSMTNNGSHLTWGMAVDNQFNVWLLQSDGAAGTDIFKISQ